VNEDEDAHSDESHEVESWLREVAHVSRVKPPGFRGAGPAGDANTTVSLDLPVAPTLRAGPPGERRLPQPGEVLDQRYRLEAVLGSGGMGVVYTATQLSTKKQVAIKWMRPREGSYEERSRAAERFVREARAAARIAHPNVLDVYDVGGDALAPYLVMERLHGESLRERLSRGPLGWDELVTLVAPVLQALDQAHAAGVVHRDLKPDNLFLATQPDGQTLLKVLDFGVSRLLSHEDDIEVSLTRTGALIGTPVYMPLEQLRGEHDLDGRTDVYAMGVVLYEALCGERPFPAKNAAEYGALLASSSPAPPSKLRPELRGARESVVLKALSRERDGRFASMEAFRAALLGAVAESHRRTGAWIVVLALTALSILAFLLFAREPSPAPTTHTAAPITPAPQPPPPEAPSAAPVQVTDRPITPAGESTPSPPRPRPTRMRTPTPPTAVTPGPPAPVPAPEPAPVAPPEPADDARMKPDEF
jgi:serine/threonine protein kinase